MSESISLFLIDNTTADDQIEAFVVKPSYHLCYVTGIVRGITVDHHIDISINVRKHSSNYISLALLAFTTHLST